MAKIIGPHGISGETDTSSTQHRDQIQVHSRTSECSVRPTQSEEPSSPLRMVSPSRHLQTNMEDMGVATDRLVCNQSKPQTPCVHVSPTRSSVLGHRRTGTTMGSNDNLCLSSSIPDQSCTKQSVKQPEPDTTPSCSYVASTGVVSRLAPPSRRRTKRTTKVEKTTETISSQSLPSQPRHVGTTRLKVSSQQSE